MDYLQKELTKYLSLIIFMLLRITYQNKWKENKNNFKFSN